jgi:alpha-1,2-mannosyltransferase
VHVDAAGSGAVGEGNAMTTTTPARRVARPTVRRGAALGAVWVIAAGAHVAQGDRHHFFDLHIYASAMRWAAAGHPLYDFAQPDKVQGSLGFTYPPFAALVLRPLAWLPLGLAEALFLTGTLVALAVTTFWLVAPVARRHGWSPWLATGFVLPVVTLMEPVRETMTFGQINMLLVILVLYDLLFAVPPAGAAVAGAWRRRPPEGAGTRAGRRRRSGAGAGWWIGGMGIGLAAAIKLTPAIFIGYLLISRRWRAAATAIGAAVLACLVAAVLAPGDSIRYWTEAFWDTARIGHARRLPNQSLYGVLARLFGSDQPDRAAWAVLVLAVAGYGLWRARRAALAGDDVTGLTLTGLVGSLCSPITWSHHVYWFVPALIIIVDVTSRVANPAESPAAPAAVPVRRRVVLGVLAGLIVATTVLISAFDWGVSSRALGRGLPQFLIGNSYVLFMLVLVALLPVRSAGVERPAGDGLTGPAAPRSASPSQTQGSRESAGRSAT